MLCVFVPYDRLETCLRCYPFLCHKVCEVGFSRTPQLQIGTIMDKRIGGIGGLRELVDWNSLDRDRLKFQIKADYCLKFPLITMPYTVLCENI